MWFEHYDYDCNHSSVHKKTEQAVYQIKLLHSYSTGPWQICMPIQSCDVKKKIITTNSSQFPTLLGQRLVGCQIFLNQRDSAWLAISIRQGLMPANHQTWLWGSVDRNGLLGWTENIKRKPQASSQGSCVWLWSKTNIKEGFTIFHENICQKLMRHYVLCRYKQYHLRYEISLHIRINSA